MKIQDKLMVDNSSSNEKMNIVTLYIIVNDLILYIQINDYSFYELKEKWSNLIGYLYLFYRISIM